MMSGSENYFQRLADGEVSGLAEDDSGLVRYKAAQQIAREEIMRPLTFEELFILKELGLAHEYISEALAEHD